MKTVNQIYKAYVEQDKTPFNIWITTEKNLFFEKKGVKADDKPEKFVSWLNARYGAGGKDLWQRSVDKTLNKQEKNSNSGNENKEAVNKADNETAKEPEVKKAPFLKRKLIYNMTPISLGLWGGGLIAGTITLVQLIRLYRKSKNK
jgi:hypothetical protein